LQFFIFVEHFITPFFSWRTLLLPEEQSSRLAKMRRELVVII
jgi:hypothetical protein